ncbi:serine hydrolase domain-containing protein [Lewinella sp. LCG006]|uniref:serine hydrolase domain-containing protein n=1 Tax=Lewinella sp. LCG006 TaxID=3231911 RepID=UPI00345FF056
MKKLIMTLALLISILVCFESCGKEEIIINNELEFEEYIQDEMALQNIPALSVLMFKEGDILYENYFGKSHIEQNVSLESDHPFLLASISKVVTATALLQLYEQELFALDNAINDYLPFPVSIPGYTTDISFRMLLTHTSGIADGSALDDQYYYGEDSPVELEYFLRNYLKPGGDFYDATDNFYDFEPGTQHEYSNTGSALIGFLVERLTGTPFDLYCKQNIFNPLGMVNTSWRLEEITGTIVQPYSFSNGGYEAIEHYTFTDYPNGGLRSTAKDMFTLLSAFVQGGMANNYALLKPITINEMITPQIPAINNEVGLHLFVMDAEHGLWGHDGGEEGVATIMAFNPDTKVGAIILANQGDAELEEILAEAYKLGLKL